MGLETEVERLRARVEQLEKLVRLQPRLGGAAGGVGTLVKITDNTHPYTVAELDPTTGNTTGTTFASVYNLDGGASPPANNTKMVLYENSDGVYFVFPYALYKPYSV